MFTRECETVHGDHGEDWEWTVHDWYNRGATPKDIPALVEKIHGNSLSCKHDGQCELAAKQDFGLEE